MKFVIPAGVVLASRVLGAQPATRVPVRELAPAEAVSKLSVTYLYGVRELSDGRLVVNDAGSRRLVLLDKSLNTAMVIADSVAGTEFSYGRSATGIIPYSGDSTLLIDLGARAFLVVDPNGNITRVMSPPRPPDVGYMWNPALGTPAFDGKGRLIYRSWLMPAFKPPEAGKPFVAPEMPDSAPILRGDFDARRADTLAWVRIAKMRIQTTQLPGGGVSLSPMINPVATLDDWTVLRDGTIAIVRGLDYHVDWIHSDGSRTSSPKMPFDWKRMSDSEKVAMVDSAKAALAREPLTASALLAAGGHAGAGGAPTGGGHSMTIMSVAAGDGSPPPRNAANVATPATPQTPQVVPPTDLPDYVPPVLRSGSMKSDPDGNIWILPSTSSQSTGGLLYDVINRNGEVFERVRIPKGRALEGFGAGGVVYLSAHDGDGVHIERARRKMTSSE